MLVWPLTMLPFLRQAKLKGPLPDGVVMKTAESPGQLVRLLKAVALRVVNTVKVPLLVAVPQALLTITL